MSEQKKIYFVIRADERGPANGPFLDRALAEGWAVAQADDCWLLEVDALGEFYPEADEGWDVSDLACWCGHPEDHDALSAFGHAVLALLRIPELVEWLSRALNRKDRE